MRNLPAVGLLVVLASAACVQSDDLGAETGGEASFPTGIDGADLAGRAVAIGAEVSTALPAVPLPHAYDDDDGGVEPTVPACIIHYDDNACGQNPHLMAWDYCMSAADAEGYGLEPVANRFLIENSVDGPAQNNCYPNNPALASAIFDCRDVECPDGQVAVGTCKAEEFICGGESKDVGFCQCEPQPLYASWATSWGISGDAPTIDSDHDGISNALEFVIGGDPVGASSSALMPTESLDTTYLNVSFRRTDVSASYAPYIQFSTNLATWTQAVHDVGGVVVVEEDDYFGVGIDRVTVRLPRAGVPSMFTRLGVIIS